MVWRLAATEDGLELRRDAARMGWVPERVAFDLLAEPLRFVRVAESWPAGTHDVVALLDRLGVPVGASTRAAEKALKDAEQGRRAQLVRAAQRYRQLLSNAPEQAGRTSGRTSEGPAGRTSGRTSEEPHGNGRDAPPDAPGRTAPGNWDAARPSRRDAASPAPAGPAPEEAP